MKKSLLAALLATVSFAGAAHAETTIGVSIPAADHGWTAGVVYHANRVAEKLEAAYPDLDVIVKTSPDPGSQANALQDLEIQGIDALVILPTDPDPLVNAIRQVKSNGKFVALVDRAPSQNDDNVRDLYVAGNNFALGEVARANTSRNATPMPKWLSFAACLSRLTKNVKTASTRGSKDRTLKFSTANSATGTATMRSASCKTT